MIDIVINNKRWSCPASWEEVTMEKAAKLYSLVGDMPDGVRDRFTAPHSICKAGNSSTDCMEESADCRPAPTAVEDGGGNGDDEIGDGIADRTGNGIGDSNFNAAVLSVMADIPAEVCLRIDPVQAAAFVDKYLSVFVAGVLGVPVCRRQDMDGFDWGGMRLSMPISAIDPQGREMPFAYVTAGELCDATELYISGGISHAAMITAILCRPDGEAYDEKIARERAAGMGCLKMPVALEIFRLIRETHSYMEREFPDCYRRNKTAGKRPCRQDDHGEAVSGAGNDICRVPDVKWGWGELPYLVGRCLPGEVAAARAMNCYDFMKLVNTGIMVRYF